jgi:hypothetical protein
MHAFQTTNTIIEAIASPKAFARSRAKAVAADIILHLGKYNQENQKLASWPLQP